MKVNDREIANDILQDVFLKYHQNLPKLREQEKIHAWLLKIAHNRIMDYFRDQKKADLTPEFFASYEPDNKLFKNRELAACINPMIEMLPEKYREAMFLTEVEGISQKALAEHLKISYSGAKSRVQRGRTLLRELFMRCCIIEHDVYGNIIDFRPRCSCQ